MAGRVLSKYIICLISLLNIVGSCRGVPSWVYNFLSLDMGVDAGLQPSNPAFEKRSSVYFLWQMLIPKLFLAISSPINISMDQDL